MSADPVSVLYEPLVLIEANASRYEDLILVQEMIAISFKFSDASGQPAWASFVHRVGGDLADWRKGLEFIASEMAKAEKP